MARLDQHVDTSGYIPLEEGAIASALSDREMSLRKLFVTEYLVDYDDIAACQRCGFERQFAIEYAKKFMDEAIVQQLIAKTKYQDLPEKEERAFDIKRIKSGLMFEAHYRGPGSSHSARVTALANLAKINGLEAAKKIDATINHRGGVMAVPGIAALSDWEAAASASQDELVRHATD